MMQAAIGAPSASGIATVAAALLVASLLAACAGRDAVAQPSVQWRSNVQSPSITTAQSRLDASAGSRTALRAQPRGGEAMLFTVDWKVVEGAAGGSVETGRRSADGSYEATYTAPANPGTYHVTATIREYPAANATTEVRVIAR